MIHCWEELKTDMCEVLGVCLLPEGHPGEHEFIPEANIKIAFGKQPTQQRKEEG